jgi:hypothetical protein
MNPAICRFSPRVTRARSAANDPKSVIFHLGKYDKFVLYSTGPWGGCEGDPGDRFGKLYLPSLPL